MKKKHIMKCRNDLTPEYVRECLDYDPDTGLMVWKKRPVEHFKNQRDCNSWNVRYAGKNAGWFRCDYFIISVNSVKYRLHRLAWLIAYGMWPKDQIDHIDGNPRNNRINNLREVSNAENHRNRRMSALNTSGYNGICSTRGKWRVRIRVNSKRIDIGTFENIDEAIKARKAAEVKYNFHPNHGRQKLYG